MRKTSDVFAMRTKELFLCLSLCGRSCACMNSDKLQTIFIENYTHMLFQMLSDLFFSERNRKSLFYEGRPSLESNFRLIACRILLIIKIC